ncbi:MAG: helix-turn-helix domain-containing protein [Holosporaceae bacterium]|jgi:transcriptional regulator with XRE-family HTH domain|nr:helix-turn-helix domain-containing protein [Holosporaceae bacterium]
MKFRGNSLLHDGGSRILYTAAQLKGRRLRMARALSGFSRQEFYEKIGIATSTIDTWESGRVELTEKSAFRVCAALRKAGIYCTGEWLLTGNGVPPRMMDELEKSMILSGNSWITDNEEEIPNSLKSKKNNLLTNEYVRRELSFFTNLHKNSVFHIVEEDFLNSRFRPGDCVAGVEESIDHLIGKIIVGILPDGSSVLCKLLNISDRGCLVFRGSDQYCLLTRAGEVVWHRMTSRK